MQALVTDRAQMEEWMGSVAYQKILHFLGSLVEAVKSKERSNLILKTGIVAQLCDLLAHVMESLKALNFQPPEEKIPQRTFQKFISVLPQFSEEILGITHHPEPVEYFVNAFGSGSLIVYGTGHELNFLAFLTSLYSLNVIKSDDLVGVVFEVFWSYWQIIQEIKRVFCIAPAGSLGIWGFDDFVLIPFVVGSSQFISHSFITPENFLDSEVVSEQQSKNVMANWIVHICQTKKPPYQESCRRLYSLRSLDNFETVHACFMRSYVKDVLNRFVVVNHFLFGEILNLSPK